MRNILAIGKREILSFFVSPIAYFVITGFILIAGYFFLNLLYVFNVVAQRYAMMPPAYRTPGMVAPNLNQIVVENFYHTLLVILVFLIPLLTMRLIAEERKNGTFELLATSPVKVVEVVLGKFLGVGFVIGVMMILIFLFPALLCAFAAPEILPILSGIAGVTVCALAFASIGMALSAITENQIVAGVSTMVFLLLLYVIQAPAEGLGGTAADILNYLSPVMQARDMIKGVVTLKSCVYFASLIGIGIFFAQRALEAQRWR